MTEYWVSVGRKFCDICQVWYANNKISTERHEQGASHKAMVQKRIRESSQKANEKEREKTELRIILSQMEQAAMASLKGHKSGTPSGPHPPQHSAPSASSASAAASSNDGGGVDRTLCPVCKVWIMDTKNSIETHERGQHHQLLVRQHFDGLQWQQTVGAMKAPKGHQYWASWTPPTAADVQQKGSRKRHQQHGSDESGAGAEPSKVEPELTKSERRKIRREREARAKAEGPPQIPEGLEEVTPHLQPKQMKQEHVDESEFVEQQQQPEEIEVAAPQAITGSRGGGSLLGAWTPVVKSEQPPPVVEEWTLDSDAAALKTKKPDIYNDLPEQKYGPSLAAKRSEELQELADIDPEDLTFKTKAVETITHSKKKVVEFRKPKSKKLAASSE